MYDRICAAVDAGAFEASAQDNLCALTRQPDPTMPDAASAPPIAEAAEAGGDGRRGRTMWERFGSLDFCLEAVHQCMSAATVERNACARLSRGLGAVRCRAQHGDAYCAQLARACNATAAACFGPLLSSRPTNEDTLKSEL